MRVAPGYTTVTTATYDGTETERVPDRYSNRAYEYHDRAIVDYDWLVPA